MFIYICIWAWSWRLLHSLSAAMGVPIVFGCIWINIDVRNGFGVAFALDFMYRMRALNVLF